MTGSRVFLLLALAAGCADSKAPRPGEPTPTPTPAPGSGICAGVTPVGGRNLALVEVASGLDMPLFVTAPEGDTRRLFVVEQRGRIRVLVDGVLRALPFLDLSARVACCGERGLLGLAFHPRYPSNGRFFAFYNAAGGDIRISEFLAPGAELADGGSERVRLTIAHAAFANHNGGMLAFGRDGFLYAGIGDGGGTGDPLRQAQDTRSLLGKVLRLDVDAAGPIAAAGNPFGNEVWAYGLRNPWRFSFDRETADLYIGDVGQSGFEEIDFEPAGGRGGVNYGWSAMEGRGHCFNDPACNSRGFTLPVLEYATREGCAVTAGYVYRGCALPDLRGTYLYGDYCAGFLRAFRIVNGAAAASEDLTAMLGQVPQLASFGEDARGEVYLVSLAGSVWRIVPR